MNINIKTIPNIEQRYSTSGDWWFDEQGDLQIRVSDMKNWKYEALVAVHELCEVLLCKEKKIEGKDVDAFDISFEKIREQHPDIIGEVEPGDMTSAPYHEEHTFATNVEKALANRLNVNWNTYNTVVEEL